jgi:hypothetical protein
MKQIGTAFLSYTGDYNGYVPGWTGWGNAIRFDNAAGNVLVAEQAGAYSDPLNDQVIWNNLGYSDRTAFPWYMRSVAVGVTPLADVRSVGDLQQAPFGPGWLLTCGYLGDARVFYCPSAGGSMIPDHDLKTGENNGYPHANSAEAWQRAGGFDGKTMTHGDWTWNARGHNVDYHRGEKFRASHVLSDYSYCISPTVSTVTTKSVAVAFARPKLTIMGGDPPFKNNRQLGGRAMASDSFSAVLGGLLPSIGYHSSWSDKKPELGRGIYAHRDGYNVIYGDGHTAWYGDPQQQLIYWKYYWDGKITFSRYETAKQRLNQTDWADEYKSWPQARGVSHLFDKAAGEDVAVEVPIP